MSYERMKKREAELKAEVLACWRPPRRRDAEEDETFGKDKRGDEMPDGSATSRSGWRRSSGRWRRCRRTPGWQWEERRIEAEKETAGANRRPQEARQTGGAAIG